MFRVLLPPIIRSTRTIVTTASGTGQPYLLPSAVVLRCIPISDAGGQCETKHRLQWTRKRVVAAHYKDDDLLHCLTGSSDISGYHADIHEGRGTVRAGQGRGMACVN